jgi:hypothetical protein
MTVCGGHTLSHPNYSKTSSASDEAARARNSSLTSIMQQIAEEGGDESDLYDMFLIIQ